MSATPDLKRTPPMDMLAMNEPIATAFNAWHEAQRNAQEVVAAFNAVTRGRAAAEAADARALADATTAGEKDPGAKNVQAYEGKLSEAKRRADAARLIERDRLGDVNRALREHGPRSRKRSATPASKRTASMRTRSPLSSARRARTPICEPRSAGSTRASDSSLRSRTCRCATITSRCPNWSTRCATSATGLCPEVSYRASS